MSGTVVLIIGVTLVIVGLIIARGGRTNQVRIGNNGFALFGSVKQTTRTADVMVEAERRATGRDWIGWSLSIIGIIVGLVGLFMD